MYVALSKDLLTAARAVTSSDEWKPWLQVLDLNDNLDDGDLFAMLG